MTRFVLGVLSVIFLVIVSPSCATVRPAYSYDVASGHYPTPTNLLDLVEEEVKILAEAEKAGGRTVRVIVTIRYSVKYDRDPLNPRMPAMEIDVTTCKRVRISSILKQRLHNIAPVRVRWEKLQDWGYGRGYNTIVNWAITLEVH